MRHLLTALIALLVLASSVGCERRPTMDETLKSMSESLDRQEVLGREMREELCKASKKHLWEVAKRLKAQGDPTLFNELTAESKDEASGCDE